MKKLPLLITIFIAAVFLPLTLNASGLTFSVSPVTAARSDNISVSIIVNNNPGFAAAGLELTYDPNVLTIVSVVGEIGDMPLNPQFALTSNPGSQWISLLNPNLQDWRGNGEVVSVIFTVRNNATLGASPIGLAFTTNPDGRPCNAAGNMLNNVAAFNSNVFVSAATPTPAPAPAATPTPATPEPTPEPVPEPEPEPEPEPTSTPSPVPTVAPAATPTRTPTATHTPTPTPTATPEESPTPTPTPPPASTTSTPERLPTDTPTPTDDADNMDTPQGGNQQTQARAFSGTIFVLVVIIGLLIVALALCGVYIYMKHKKETEETEPEYEEEEESDGNGSL